MFTPSQWETSLQSNTVSHWLGGKPRISPVMNHWCGKAAMNTPLHCFVLQSWQNQCGFIAWLMMHSTKCSHPLTSNWLAGRSDFDVEKCFLWKCFMVNNAITAKIHILGYVPEELFEDKSTLNQVIAWCLQAITWSNVDSDLICHLRLLDRNPGCSNHLMA